MKAVEGSRGLRWWLLAAMVLVSLQLRAPITAVPPALARVAEALGLSRAAAGAVTSLPLLCFGLFAFVTPFLAARLGLEPTLWAAAVLVLVGLGVRHDARLLTFFGGTLLIGLGIALGNVVLPALARTWFPDRLPLVMGIYTVMIQVSGAAGPLATTPLMARGWEWPAAVTVWFWPCLAAVVLWTAVSIGVARARRGHPHHGAEPHGLGRVLKRPLSWMITFVQGTQSLIFFSLVTWLPVQLRTHGFTEGSLAAALGAYSLLGIPGCFLAARLVQGRGVAARLVTLTLAYVVGIALLATSPTGALIGLVICGLCQGLTLTVSLTFIAAQDDPRDVPAVSALAQGIGYAWAAVGPVLVGVADAAAGTLVAGHVLLIAFAVPLGAACVWVSRRVHG